MLDGYRVIVVGAGFTGAVVAERTARLLGEPVLVLEQRPHSGGNAWSALDPHSGIECHCYGSHIFHTRHADVWQYISSFGEFSSYRHKVMTEHKGRAYTMPISLDTINSFYGLNLKPWQAEAFILDEVRAAGISDVRNLEEQAISLIGRPLYEAFIKGYTRKQWNRDPRELPASIIRRLPVRSNYNTDYFNDPWQGIPLEGYGGLFTKLLAHPLINVRHSLAFDAALKAEISRRPHVLLVYTGMIDRYFDFAYGELTWRSLRFEQSLEHVADWQGISVMNYADDSVPWTRIHEYKHYHPERHSVHAAPQTVICREYPQDWTRDREPYYPVNDAANQARLAHYQQLAATQPQLLCAGRLGAYAYMDMDQAIKQALDLFEQRVRPWCAAQAQAVAPQ